jgi:hypothetical protein
LIWNNASVPAGESVRAQHGQHGVRYADSGYAQEGDLVQKKTNRKLTLSRETIATIQRPLLQEAAGGAYYVGRFPTQGPANSYESMCVICSE